MLSNALTVGNQVFTLFILIAVGYATNKLKIFDAKSIKALTNFVLYIVCPAIIVLSFQKDYTPDRLKDIGIGLVVSAATMISMILLGPILIHHKDKKRENVLKFGIVFSNSAFMSIPLQAAILGDTGVFYGATYIAVFSMLLWTFGVWLMGGGFEAISVKQIILNANILAVIVGVLLFLLRIKIPTLLYTPMNYLASLNTPVPMVIIGYHLANAKIKIDSVAEVVAIFTRHFISPLIMLVLCKLFNANPILSVAMIIAASAPFASNTTMFSDMFGGGDVAYSASAVSLSTLLSILTMPVIIAIAMM